MKIRKHIAFIVVLCLVLSMSVTGTAFAAESAEGVMENISEAAADMLPEGEAAIAPEEIPVEEVPAAEAYIPADAQAILSMAASDGAAAAAQLNTITDDALYLDILRQVLDMYYSGDMTQYAAFTGALQARAAQLIAAYEGAAAERQSEDLQYVPGEIIIMFQNGASEASLQSAAMEEPFAIAQSTELATGDIMGLVDIPLSKTVDQAIEMFESMPDIAFAQRNYVYTLPKSEKAQGISSNDPLLQDQWYMDKIDVSQAWNTVDAMSADYPNLKKTRVTVIDSPIDMNHEDLQTALNKELCADTSQGVLLPPMVDIGFAEHGTHVSGTIAATSNNGKGIAGVASGSSNNIVDLVSVSMFDTEGKSTSYSLALALNYAISIDSDVINMSLGSSPPTPYPDKTKLERAMCDAAYSRGIIVLAAAGNDNNDEPSTPSDFLSVISIMATKNWTDKDDAKADFSSYGSAKDFTAPGVDIVNCIPFNQYDLMSGTSMATPITSGVVAMMKYLDSSLNTDKVYSILKGTSTDLYSPGFDIYSGWGEINAGKAVIQVARDVILSQKPAMPKNLKAASTAYNSVQLSWSPVADATGYVIYKTKSELEYEDNSYYEYARVKTNSFTDKTAFPGRKNSYKVAAYLGDGLQLLGEFTQPASVTPVCAAPKNLSASGISPTAIALEWGSVSGAKGYYVYRAASKNSKYTYVGKVTGTSFRDIGLSANTKYYYKVFTYSLGTGGQTLRGKTADPVSAKTGAI